jgi:hypothetical protein
MAPHPIPRTTSKAPGLVPADHHSQQCCMVSAHIPVIEPSQWSQFGFCQTGRFDWHCLAFAATLQALSISTLGATFWCL